MKEHSVKLLAVGEDQSSIADWAEQTFGPVENTMVIAARANAEMSELLRVIAHNPSAPLAECADQFRMAVADEAADVMILLYRLAEIGRFDLLAAVDRKMRINRKRKWKLSGDGTGRHVRDDGVRS